MTCERQPMAMIEPSRKPSFLQTRRLVVALVLVLLAAAAGFAVVRAISVPDITSQPKSDPALTVIESEELLLRLGTELKRLTHNVLNLKLPDDGTRPLFAPEIEVQDLASGQTRQRHKEFPTVAVSVFEWPIEPTARRVPSTTLSLLRPLLDRVEYFDYASFYFIRGEFANRQQTAWAAKVGFKGTARTTDGQCVSVKATQNVRFEAVPRTRGWQIVAWHLEHLKTIECDRPLFREVSDEAIPDPVLRARARESIHERLLVQSLLDKNFVPPHRFFSAWAFDQQPGLAVVDLDRDGFDDLFALERLGKCLFLRNRADGTFEEVAASLGIDVEDHCSCAIFADFDNDGDADLFLGRTLERTMYFENAGGHFVDRSAEKVSVPLPYLVLSMAAADYNGDGLLDIYLATYAGDLVEREMLQGKAPRSKMLLADFLHEDAAGEMYRRALGRHMILDRPGPPNVLLANRGGRFEPAPESSALAVWRNTYQATWADFDDDGDADLYAANDFGPHNLFRNDGGAFVDVTEESGTADIGFGMGASWGDYDNDRRLDLYVSNMYSKAGRRITAQVPNVDPRLQRMARGNTLFHNRGPKFEQVSGTEAPALLVEEAGWSWGSQFVDVNNDGRLDIYALSGFYTAPVDVEGKDDL